MEELNKLIPRIYSAVDLTHLQPNERIGLVGNENLKNRREFLIKLFSTGIAVGLPVVLFSSCKPIIKYIVSDEEDCPTFKPTGDGNSCACNTDATASVAPRVVNTIPESNSTFVNDQSGVEIRIDIDKAIDITTVTGAVTMSPQPSGGFDIHVYALPKNNVGYKTSLSLYQAGTSGKLALADDTTYTVTLKGTLKDTNGNKLDGNNDGTGGDDFNFSFKTIKKYNSCICQSDCSCVGNTCSCQSYSSCSCQSYSTCSCQSNTCYYCSCMYMGCPLYRV